MPVPRVPGPRVWGVQVYSHIIVQYNICVYICAYVMLAYHLHTIFWRIHLYILSHIRYMGLHTNILSVYIGVASH